MAGVGVSAGGKLFSIAEAKSFKNGTDGIEVPVVDILPRPEEFGPGKRKQQPNTMHVASFWCHNNNRGAQSRCLHSLEFCLS